MLLGLHGPHGIGKSYVLDKLMDDYSMSPNVYMIHADASKVYNCDDGGNWALIPHMSVSAMWNTTSEYKIGLVEDLVSDREYVYVIESARWMSSIHKYIVDSYKRNHGGAKFVIVTTTPDTLKDFLVARCCKSGKAFRADYWTDTVLEYDSHGRYVNPAVKWFSTNRIPYEVIQVGETRCEMERVAEQLRWWISREMYDL